MIIAAASSWQGMTNMGARTADDGGKWRCREGVLAVVGGSDGGRQRRREQ